MKIVVKRVFNCATYCISHIYINGEYVCDGIEDTDRMLNDDMPESYIYDKKVYGKTAIPVGIYKMSVNVVSSKFCRIEYYNKICKGKLPRLENVPGFNGILWHCGNTANDSAGCLILGYNKEKGKVLDSKLAFEKVYKLLNPDEDIYVFYIRTY